MWGVKMKCIACGSDETYWIDTTMEDQTEGFETYACSNCRGQTEYGFIIKEVIYTGKNGVFPFEES
jgi:hypothetical protein